MEIGAWFSRQPPLVQAWIILIGAALLGLLAYGIVFRAIAAVARRAPRIVYLKEALLRHSRGPARFLFPLIAVRLALPLTSHAFTPEFLASLDRLLGVLFVVCMAWLLINLTNLFDDLLSTRFDIRAEDNLRARKIRTRTTLLRRIATAIILIVALAAVLLNIPQFRALGTGLLASAGLIGVVVGVAAQRPISNLVAGLQIAITQPFRVDDVVIVEGEWGWIEEITLTYVVVRIWDLRRLVLPIGYFVEHPFQNWTRTTASILGTVFLYLDYSVPVEELRRELVRIVEASPHWDREVCVLQMTNLTERTVELRAVVSAANAGHLWELRCEAREGLVAFVCRNYPEALPRTRARIEDRPGERGTGEAGTGEARRRTA